MKETLAIMKYLLEEIEDEIKLQEEYDLEKEKAWETADKYNKENPDKPRKYDWCFMKWNKPIPTKSTIEHNLKKIRKLCLKLYSN